MPLFLDSEQSGTIKNVYCNVLFLLKNTNLIKMIDHFHVANLLMIQLLQIL